MAIFHRQGDATHAGSKRREIVESVIAGRKFGAEMARLYNISQPIVSRIVAQHPVVST
jgi:hypothetical protein